MTRNVVPIAVSAIGQFEKWGNFPELPRTSLTSPNPVEV